MSAASAWTIFVTVLTGISLAPGCSRGDQGPVGFDASAFSDAASDSATRDALPSDAAGSDADSRDATPGDAGGLDAARDAGPPLSPLESHWALSIGPAELWGLGVDGTGNIYVGGNFADVLNVGATPRSSAGMTDVYLIKLNRDGEILWIRVYGGTGPDRLSSLSVAADGTVAFGATVGSDSIDFGAGPLTRVASRDCVFVELDASGELRWARRYGVDGTITLLAPRSIFVEDGGAMVVGGDFRGSGDLGAATMDTVGEIRGFVASIDGSGGTLSSFLTEFGVTALAKDSAGNIGTGFSFGTDDFKSHTPLGEVLWSLDLGLQTRAELAAGSGDRWYAIGEFRGTVDFGPEMLSAGGFSNNGYLMALRADETVDWARGFIGSSVVTASSVAVDGASILAAGSFRVDLKVASEEYRSAGIEDIFLTEWSSSGALLASRVIGGTMNDRKALVAAGADGTRALAGKFQGRVDFGSRIYIATSDDVFVLHFE